ncbi:peptidoglycan-binding protein [Ottowia beijingensis]|uniref:Peptidoglycan-binding protein n=1 Tax=Ottowia beijingensis TaxID=1207057 RepID=A0A853IV80_9BURK|nr:peptidoglycan-binding protein [Ottowia beijingensis]
MGVVRPPPRCHEPPHRRPHPCRTALLRLSGRLPVDRTAAPRARSGPAAAGPITPPPQLLPPHGRVVTAPLPGRPEPAPVVAPARLTLRDAQTRLNGMGYDAGPADGVVGRRTAAALRAFQRDHGLPDSGRLDEATRQALTAPR